MATPPSDQELLSLLGQLTLDEKISMLGGRNFWETVAIDRLGIPSLKVTSLTIPPLTDPKLTGLRSAMAPTEPVAPISSMARQPHASRHPSRWLRRSTTSSRAASASP